jgi:hypothetical protein
MKYMKYVDPNSRSNRRNQHKRKIKWIEQNSYSLIPPKNNKHSIHPTRNLRNARNGTPFGLNVIHTRLRRVRTWTYQRGYIPVMEQWEIFLSRGG